MSFRFQEEIRKERQEMSERLKALREHGKAMKRYRANGYKEKDWLLVVKWWERYMSLSSQYEMELKIGDPTEGTPEKEGAPRGGPQNGSESP